MKRFMLLVAAIFAASPAIGQTNDYPTYRTTPKYIRSSPPKGLSYGGQQEFFDDTQCQWVDETGTPTNMVTSYYMRSCGNARVCVGSAKCNAKLPDGSTFTYFLDGVTCAANAGGGCLVATECVLDGGFLDDVPVRQLMRSPRPKTVQPGVNAR